MDCPEIKNKKEKGKKKGKIRLTYKKRGEKGRKKRDRRSRKRTTYCEFNHRDGPLELRMGGGKAW